jgi:hypothetical protein
MPLGLRSPATDHPGHHHHAHGRGEYEGHPLRQWSQDIGKAAALIEEQPLYRGDHPPEADRGDPGKQADGRGEGQRSGRGGTAQFEAQAMKDLAVSESVREADAKGHEGS